MRTSLSENWGHVTFAPAAAACFVEAYFRHPLLKLQIPSLEPAAPPLRLQPAFIPHYLRDVFNLSSDNFRCCQHNSRA